MEKKQLLINFYRMNMKKIIIIIAFVLLIYPVGSFAAIAPCGLLGPCPTPVCPTPTPPCTSYAYGGWSATCNSDGQKTRVLLQSYPEGCGGQCATTSSVSPVLSSPCYPPNCTSLVYSNWSDCKNGQQTRTVVGKEPAGCEEKILISSVLTQSCTITPASAPAAIPNVVTPTPAPAVTPCVGRIYSNWSDCANGQQERIVLSKTPSGCVGEPQKELVLRQSCGSGVVEQNNIAPAIKKKTPAAVVELKKSVPVTTTTETEKIDTQKSDNQPNAVVTQESKASKITNRIINGLKRFFIKIKFWKNLFN